MSSLKKRPKKTKSACLRRRKTTMGKKNSKKVNPRRRPATEADVKRAKQSAQEKAVNIAWAIFFTVLRDKENADAEILRRVWDEVNDLSDSVSQGYVSVSDLMRTLAEEAGIVLE